MMLFVLVLLVGTVTAQGSVEGRRTLCGRELAKAHSLYCYGLDAVPEESVEVKLAISDSDIVGTPKIPERFTYKQRRAADRGQFASSLVETCCLKPCHVTELLNHC